MIPDIMQFIEATDLGEILPHEVEPYKQFDGERKDLAMVIVKSRMMRGTEFAKNVSLFDITGRFTKFINVAYLSPRQETARRYSYDRLVPELNKPYSYLGSQVEETRVSNIRFSGDCNYYVCSAADADALHGLPADFLIRDEVGAFSKAAIDSSDPCLSAAKTKIQLDIGTPSMNPEGYQILKQLWNQSDKRVFFYCCTGCDNYFRPTMDLLCGITDVRCPECGKEQEKLEASKEGKWVPMRNPEKAWRVGYHFTQLINPLIETAQLIRWKAEYSPAKFSMEVLGEI